MRPADIPWGSPMRRLSIGKAAGCSWVALTMMLAGCAAPARQAVVPMRLPEYAGIRHDTPYVFKACAKGATLAYVGVRHSRSLQDESIAAVMNEIAEASPTIVLVEGAVPAVSPSLEDAAQTWGESGVAAYLARARGVTVASLEGSLAEQATDLRQAFGGDKVIAFYGLRAIAQERGRAQSVFDLGAFLDKRLLPWLYKNSVTAQVLSVDAFRAVVARVTGMNDAASAPESRWFDPLAEGDLFGFRTMSGHLVSARDITMANRLVKSVLDGGRVLAVAGYSHVVMQEPAIRYQLACKGWSGSGVMRSSPSIARCDETCGAE